jgi:hypothetical protein
MNVWCRKLNISPISDWLLISTRSKWVSVFRGCSYSGTVLPLDDYTPLQWQTTSFAGAQCSGSEQTLASCRQGGMKLGRCASKQTVKLSCSSGTVWRSFFKKPFNNYICVQMNWVVIIRFRKRDVFWLKHSLNVSSLRRKNLSYSNTTLIINHITETTIGSDHFSHAMRLAEYQCALF